MGTAIIYCDGSFDPIRKIGGIGIVALFKGITEIQELHEDASSSTRAELIGVVRAIEVFGPKSSRLKVITDCKPIVDVLDSLCNDSTNWSKALKNKDLWFRLYSLTKQYIIELSWVKSHSGDQYNDRADYLARQSIGVEHGGIVW